MEFTSEKYKFFGQRRVKVIIFVCDKKKCVFFNFHKIEKKRTKIFIFSQQSKKNFQQPHELNVCVLFAYWHKSCVVASRFAIKFSSFFRFVRRREKITIFFVEFKRKSKENMKTVFFVLRKNYWIKYRKIFFLKHVTSA